MLLVSSSSCLYPICWSQVLSWEWRCSWSSAERRCSKYIWVINNLIANLSASYIILETWRYTTWNINFEIYFVPNSVHIYGDPTNSYYALKHKRTHTYIYIYIHAGPECWLHGILNNDDTKRYTTFREISGLLKSLCLASPIISACIVLAKQRPIGGRLGMYCIGTRPCYEAGNATCRDAND